MKHTFFRFAVFSIVFLLSRSVAAQWVRMNRSYVGSIPALAVSGGNLIAGTGSPFGGDGEGAFVSTDNGASWVQSSAGLQYGHYKGDVTCLQVSGANIFAGTDSGVFLSTNAGKFWTSWRTGLPPDCFVTAIATVGTDLFACAAGSGTTREVFLSTDSNTTWRATSTGLGGGSAWALAANGTDLFVGTLKGVFVSHDSGISWIEVNTGLNDSIVLALAANETNLFAGTMGGGVFRSTNNGVTWTSANVGLPSSITVKAFSLSGKNLFAGILGNGVFLSSDNGTTWSAVNTGLMSTDVYTLALNGSYLFAGTKSGVWRRPLSEMIGTNAVTNSRSIEHKLQSFPNPFSIATTISFSAENGYAKVYVVNVLAVEVARLHDGELHAGDHSFSWDASKMPPGVYQCIIQTDGHAERVSITVVR